MFTLRKKAQNLDKMKFCKNCEMNVFPSKPKFDVKIFGIFVVILLIAFTSITILISSLFLGFFLFIFIMWGFMIINPYLIYYGVKKKQYCPNCYREVGAKNLEYEPFGDIKPEIYKRVGPVNKSNLQFYCPYCGYSLTERVRFCMSCGKKLDILR